MKKRNWIFTVLAVLMAFTIVLPSCEDEPDAMELPPEESMVIDFSAFGTPQDTVNTTKAVDSTYTNWFHSFVNVSFWNVFTGATLAVPVAAYGEALNHEPVYMGDNTWEWQYSYTFNASTYTARLVGSRLNNEAFSMTMYITKTGMNAYEEFKWFEGTVRYDHTHASWTLYESPDNPVALLSVEWNKDYETGESDITYEVVKESSEHVGDYIEFAVMPEDVYDAHYDIVLQRGTVEIEWDRTTMAGRVRDENKFGDANWHCWDENLMDSDCPQ